MQGPLRRAAAQVLPWSRFAAVSSSSSAGTPSSSGWIRSYADDTHDDFKPQLKSQPAAGGDISSVIQQHVTTHPVFLYMKGHPQAPRCGFSNMACQVLNAYGVKFGSANVLEDADLRDGIKKYTNWPTIPQVFVKGEFVGGADILMDMHNSGELEKLLQPVLDAQKAAKASA